MRNYIVYFLTSLFLLFMVESKLNVKTLRSDFSGHIAHNYPNKIDQSNRSVTKFSVNQITDTTDGFSIELAEDDFHFSDTVQTIIVFASVFGLIYSFGLLFKKRFKPSISDFLPYSRSVRTFILIRSIRI
ncbi:hypothetical protein LPB85_09130 [Chryseobacterium sp. LC2016-27]|jgi:hypothetical protein|uniref:hypothetical protein n=1 Tax=Chryseobacterium sp. LC2016-27 TaxID=2897326 RepID=UPI001E58FFC0|nr:hypothetical protein [Chryseobacterium sp. LC2016-27]MCD0455612.1 hypothetical protein [Chryseobacterium sp. LC2016-27]